MSASNRKRTEHYLRAQYALSRALAESSTLREVTSKLLAVMGESMGWAVGAFWGLDRGRSELRCLAVWLSTATSAPEFEAAN